jgi:predicted peptidase
MLMGGLTGCGASPTPAHAFTFHSHSAAGTTYPYAVYAPPGLPENPPLVLFLHGSGESGTDGTRAIGVGIGRELLMHPEDWPAVVVIPQKPSRATEWPAHEAAVLAILDREVAAHNPSYVALTGLSQGGHGAWIIGSRHAERFNRIAPVCGYVRTGSDRLAEAASGDPAFKRVGAALAGTPVWAFHGDADSVVPVQQSRAAVEAVHRAGGDAKLTVYEGVGHESWLNAYAEPGFAAWLLSPAD